jgi:hypothetical protein
MALKRIRPHEHFTFWEFLRLVSLHVILDLSEARRRGLAVRKWPDVLWFRWMQFWGTYRGFSIVGPLTGKLKEAFYYPSQKASEAPCGPRRGPRLDYALLVESDRLPSGDRRRRVDG